MDIVLSSSRLRPILFALMALVVIAGVTVEVMKEYAGLPRDEGFGPLLSLSDEYNVPTLYSAGLAFTCALVLAVIAVGTKTRGARFVPHWWVLAAGFTYIAIDELMQIHEHAHDLVHVDVGGVLYFSWVIPAAVVVLAVGLAYIRFLWALALPIRIRFILAGIVYVGGAVGMELPLGWWSEHHGIHNLGYGLIDAAEEALEMLGLNLFLLALLAHLGREAFTVRFAPASEASS